MLGRVRASRLEQEPELLECVGALCVGAVLLEETVSPCVGQVTCTVEVSLER